jgi:hypothetical protein
MTVGLFVLGILATATGVAMLGFGIPINEFSLGNTLIIAGTVASVGGLVLIGLAGTVRQLGRVIEAVAVKPAARGSRPAEGFDIASRDIAHPRPGPTRAPFAQHQRGETPGRDQRLSEPRLSPVSAESLEEYIMERSRQAFPASPRYGEAQLVEAAEEAPLSPRVASRAPARPVSPAVSDFVIEPKAWSPSPTRPGVAAARNDAGEPKRTAPPEPAREVSAPRGHDERAMDVDRSAPSSPRGGQPASERRPVAILKSGVVDGMAYTLYTDGSIEAELTEGVVRFGSIDELRTHLEKSS